MIAYLLFLQLKNYLLRLKKPLHAIIAFAIILGLVLYGWIIGNLLNMTDEGKFHTFSVPEVKLFIFTFIIVFLLSIRIFPRYKPLKPFLPGFMPVTKFEQYQLSVFTEFAKPFYLGVVLFMTITSLFVKNGGFLFFMESIMAIASALLLGRIVQYGVDYKLKSNSIPWFIIAGILVFVSIFYSTFWTKYLMFFGLFILLSLFFIGYKLEKAIIEFRKISFSNESTKLNIYLKMLIYNPKVRSVFIMGFGFKIVFLVIDFFMFKYQGKHIFEGQIIYWMFASPLIVFTYVFNNFWAYWKSHFLNYEIRLGDYREMVKLSYKLILIPLIVDLVVTLPLLLSMWEDYTFILVFYCVSTLFMLSFFHIWSILYPMNIKTSFQMKGTSSFLSNLITISSVLLLVLLKVNYWFYILVPIYFIASYVGYSYSFELYKTKKYALYKKLFKE